MPDSHPRPPAPTTDSPLTAPSGLPPALAPGSRLLHIGPQKTGSTALQSALHETRDQMAALGVVYPGPHRKPVRALAAGLGATVQRGAPPPRPAAWQALLDQLPTDGRTRACLSHEGMARFDDDQIARTVSSLGGERPHVVLVARRYDTYLPSQWQERVKGGRTQDFEHWLRIVLDDERADAPAWRNVWVPHDTTALVTRWSAVVGPENLTVVVAAESDRRRLLDVVEALLDLPAGLLRPDPAQRNRSLSHPETELLRRVNQAMRRLDADDQTWFRLMERGLVPALTKRPYPDGESPAPGLPAWAREEVERRTAQREQTLPATGVRIIGDLAALRPVWPAPPTVDPGSETEDPHTPTPDSVLIETALAAIMGVVKQARRP